MEFNIIRDEKEDILVELDNLTIIEILRNYLDKDSNVDFVAWKREHPTKKPVLSVKGKNPKKAMKDAIKQITKDLDNLEKDFSKI